MSHEATNWAIKQRGIKPAAKIVLWHLCDRYHPDNGCFPSLDTLAEDCEMSRRSVQDQINSLVEAGLVFVEKTVRNRGRLPSNSYRFPFEKDLGQNLPQAESALGKNEPSPLANSRNHLGQNLPTNPVRGTSKRTSKPKSEAEQVLEALLTFLSQDVAEDFIGHRKDLRKPLTMRAVKLIEKDLKGHPNPNAAVQATIKNGWAGVFAKEGRDQPRQSHQQQTNTDADKLSRWNKIAAK